MMMMIAMELAAYDGTGACPVTQRKPWALPELLRACMQLLLLRLTGLGVCGNSGTVDEPDRVGISWAK